MCLGIPGQIIEIIDVDKLIAKVDVSGVQRNVNIACVVTEEDNLEDYVGVWVLLHVGFAMSKIDEDEAIKTLKILAELGEIAEEHKSMKHSGEA